MRPSVKPTRRVSAREFFWDLLTFDRLMTGPLVHLIYWAGLGILTIMAFGIIGTTVGLALRGEDFSGVLLAVAVGVAGFLVIGALVLMWRAFCEFYVAIVRISDDLRALRQAADAEAAHQTRLHGQI